MPMKTGFILECGPEGADVKVCRSLVSRIKPDIAFVPITLDNKPKLISGCGDAAKQLLASGCERVFIIWDLFPAWRDNKAKPCRKEDRENIFQALKDADVPVERVTLICIDEELEAWLIADGRAISEFLSTATKRISIADEKKPDRAKNPKKLLNRHFAQNGKGNYIDYLHAEKLVRLIPDFQKLRRSETFRRLYQKLGGKEL